MRLTEFQADMKKKRINYVLLINFNQFYPSMYYFSRYNGIGCLIIPKKGNPVLLVPKMEHERAKLTKNRVRVYRKDLYSAIKKNIGRCKRIGIDKTFLTLDTYSRLKSALKGVRFVDVSKTLHELRAVKTNQEIELIRKSCALAVKILHRCIKNFRFKTELEVAEFLETEAKRCKTAFAFTPIVASGKNASLVHHPPKPKKLNRGFLVIDLGVWLNGYCSDITRTFYIGKPTKKEVELYNLVLKCQKTVIASIKPGKTCSETDEIARKKLRPMRRYFMHGLGHGVGVEIHELPNLKQKSKERFRINNVFTIEPGIYVPNKFGIRIEDVVLLTDKGVKVLTTMPKELKVIKEKVY